MIKNMFVRAVLLSMAVFSFSQQACGQQSASGSGSGATEQPTKVRSGEEFTLDGVLLTASRVRWFNVSVGTLQIQPYNSSGGMGGMEGGGGGMGGMGGDMGSGDGYGGSGMAADGSEGGMGMGGMGGGKGMGMHSMGMGGMGTSPGMGGGMGMGMSGSMGMDGGMRGMEDMRLAVAFIMDEEQVAGRTRIEVLTPRGAQGNYVRLEALTGARPSNSKTDKRAQPLWSPATAKLIKDTISLKIWKEDAIKTLKAEEGSGEQAAASEKLLKAVLSEEYDSQLARQQFELARLQERLKHIQAEFTRRQQAKDRVIDVQLGKIILEAQGILGDNQ